MKYAAKIDGGIVVDVSVLPDGAIEAPEGWIFSEAPIGRGWAYDAEAETFSDPTQPQEVAIDWTTAKLSRFEFLKSFTAAERIAIKAANDPIINDALDMFREAGAVVLAYPDTQQLIGYLAQQQHLTPARAAEILSGSWVEAVRSEIL
jgi:hypothetical protein